MAMDDPRLALPCELYRLLSDAFGFLRRHRSTIGAAHREEHNARAAHASERRSLSPLSTGRLAAAGCQAAANWRIEEPLPLAVKIAMLEPSREGFPRVSSRRIGGSYHACPGQPPWRPHDQSSVGCGFAHVRGRARAQRGRDRHTAACLLVRLRRGAVPRLQRKASKAARRSSPSSARSLARRVLSPSLMPFSPRHLPLPASRTSPASPRFPWTCPGSTRRNPTIRAKIRRRRPSLPTPEGGRSSLGMRSSRFRHPLRQASITPAAPAPQTPCASASS